MRACILTTRSSRGTRGYRGELEDGVEEKLEVEVEVQAGPEVGVEDGMVEEGVAEEEEGSFLEDGLEETVAGTSSSTIKIPRQRLLASGIYEDPGDAADC